MNYYWVCLNYKNISAFRYLTHPAHELEMEYVIFEVEIIKIKTWLIEILAKKVVFHSLCAIVLNFKNGDLRNKMLQCDKARRAFSVNLSVKHSSQTSAI